MKDYFNLKKSRWLLFMLLAMIAGGASPARADELTVYDGTDTSEYLPIYGYYCDNFTKAEFIMPASDLEELAGSTITNLTFYFKTPADKSWGDASFQVFLKEVDDATITSYSGPGTIVYEGSLDGTGQTMTVDFTNSFDYSGSKNLLIGIYNTVKGTYSSYGKSVFYGKNTGTQYISAYGKSASTLSSVSLNNLYNGFLPKTTFTYTSAAGVMPRPKSVTASNVKATSASIDWTAGGSETSWEISYGTDSTEPAEEGNYTTVSSTSYSLTGLSAETTYYFFVRAKDGDSHSSWAKTSFTTTPTSTSADEGYTDDFEAACTWKLINGGLTNAWVCGEATNNGGSKALYISNDGGTSNAYGTVAAIVYATKLFTFEGGMYSFAYDWICKGEKSSYGNTVYDYLRVALVPANVELAAGTSAPSNFYSSLPTGWIALDGGAALVDVSTWQHKNIELAVEAGSYYVVLAWTNDGSGGSNPPAAVDNFSISVLACPTPTGLAVSDITAHGATLTWATSNNTWEVYCSTSSETPAADVEVTAKDITTNSYTFTSLAGETKYYVWVRSVSGSDKSEWAGTNFTTLVSCAKPTALSISDITSTSATLTWTAGAEGQDAWQVEWSTASDFTGSTVEDVTTATKTFTRLTPATTYYARVRSKCGGEDGFSAWTDAISFTTLQVAVSAEYYYDNFNEACNWTFVNGTLTNAWAWGTAGAKGDGGNGLFISNDGGTTNAYTNSSTAMVYATKLFSFDGGTYTFAYNWKCNGESTYDYLRVALVPADVTFTAGTTTPASFSATSLPTGWIALDGGSKLNLKSDWQIISNEISVSEGSYYVVFAWRDDTSGGSNPPAAIDNFKVQAVTCPTPTGLAISDITAHGATLTWATSNNTWEVYCSTSSETPAADVTVTGTATTNSYTFTELKGNTTYYVWVRSVSGENKSEWAGSSFTTEPSCIAPSALAVTGLKDTSVTLTWTDDTDGQDTWQVSYRTTSGSYENIVTVSEKSCTITGLTAGNTYYAYVRAYCSEDDQSAWSEVCSFTPGVFIANDGTTTNSYVPIYGYDCDMNNVKSQFIIPADVLGAIANSEISKMVFHSSTTSQSWGNATFDIYLKNVTESEFASTDFVDWDSMTKVYAGALSVTSNKMTVELSETFEYTGGNLLVGFYQTAKGNSRNVSWYGVSTDTNVGVAGSSSYSYRKFLPKTSFYFTSVSNEAKMVVSTDALDFGLVKPTATAEEKQLTFAIQNKGKADLTGINVSYTGDAAISVSTVENATIKAKDDAEYEDITVTVTIDNATPGDFTGTITVSADNQEPATVAVSATVLDPEKMFEDFAGNALPQFWATEKIGSSAGSWNFANGYARYTTTGWASYLDNYKSALVSPEMMSFTADEEVKFMVKKDKSYDTYTSYMQVEYYDGTNWTATSDGTFEEADLPEDWQIKTVTVPASASQIRFVACGVSIDNIYGGKLPSGARFAIDATDGSIKNFGFVEQNTAADITYTVTNEGNAELSVTIDVPEGFSADPASLAIGAGETSQFTLSMETAIPGEKSGNVTITTNAIDVNTFTIPVTGYVADNSKILVDFANNELPAGWINSGFTISGNEATRSGYMGTLTSPAITVAEGDKMIVYARGRATASAALTVKYSADNGSSWTTAKEFTTELRHNTTDYALLTVDNIEAGNYILKFEGDNVTINTINGYTYNQDAPNIGVTLAGTAVATGYNDNFGAKVKEALTHTYTIKNTGTGTLTGTITSSVPEHFTVSQSEFSLAKDETLDFDLSLVFDETYEDKASVITIHPTIEGLADIVINASATTKDPNIWEEDFEGKSIPAFWTTTGWTVSQPSSLNGGNGTYMAGMSNATTATLTTPRLEATAGEVLKYYVYAESDTYFIKAEYSNDEQATWTEIATYTEAGDKEFTAPADGLYYLRFTGYYTYLDNFEGFKLNLPDHIAAISAYNIPSYGLKEGVSFNATVTVKESRGVAEEFTANVYQGDEVIGTATGTVDANGSKQLTIAATPVAAGEDEEMHIEVVYAGGTLTTETVTRSVAAVVRLDLTETEETEITTGTTYDIITLQHSFVAGWNTFVAPLGVNVSEFGEGAKVYSFTGYDDSDLSFSVVTATSIYAATPYIVYVPEAFTKEFTWTNSSISSLNVGEDNIKVTRGDATSGYATFQGTYAPMAVGTMQGKYGVTPAGKIAKGGAGASMKGFRAYFELPEGATARLAFTDVVTGITTVIAADELDGGMYNMKGQKVENTNRKGLYIINGKKTVVK